MDARINMLERWAAGIVQAAGAGALTGDPNKPLRLRSVQTVRGPRAGALEIDAGLDSGRLLRVLTVDDCALHRQFVPWDFLGDPSAYMMGRYVRLEAGWPDNLAEKNIPLESLGQHPAGGGRWIAGKNETGATVTLGLDSQKAHYLFGGWTGSGKTWALRAALVQLARDPLNRLVLIDAKWGDSLGCLRGLPGLIGPIAVDLTTAKGALSWAVGEMRRRYESGDHAGRVIVAVDEVQELSGDPGAVEMLRRLIVQGRGAGVHVLLGTQHPTKDAFGDPAIKRNLAGRVALRVEDGVASNVVVGGPNPRADHLLGAGDAYAVTPGAVQRLQMAYIPEKQLPTDGQPMLEAWPEFDAEAAGTLPEDHGGGFEVSGVEAAVAIHAANLGKGRPALQRMLQEATGSKPGGSRSERLLTLGREGWAWLQDQGLMLCDGDESEDDESTGF